VRRPQRLAAFPSLHGASGFHAPGLLADFHDAPHPPWSGASPACVRRRMNSGSGATRRGIKTRRPREVPGPPASHITPLPSVAGECLRLKPLADRDLRAAGGKLVLEAEEIEE